MKPQKTMARMAVVGALALMVGACGSKKSLVDGQTVKTTTDATTSATAQTAPKPQEQAEPAVSADAKKANFLQRVADNAATTQTIAAKLKFNIQSGSKDFTVPGTLRMKKDDVIRLHLQIPFLGSEAGRLEFTRDYVLILDRIHKEYVKADYNEVDFLKRNGLTFSSLQALFWNQLFVPGTDQLTPDALSQLSVDWTSTAAVPITLTKGNMTYTWQTNQQALIEKTTVAYQSRQNGNTKVEVSYADFKPLGVKVFPGEMGIAMTTTAVKGKAKDVRVNLTLSNLSTDGDWETRTDISKKFKQVSVDEVMQRLMSITK